MKKKWGMVLILAVAVVLFVVLWTSRHEPNVILVKGNISPQTISEIKAVIKQDMRRRIFPDFSGASFKGLLAGIKAYFQYDIAEIEGQNKFVFRVKVRKREDVTKPKWLKIGQGTELTEPRWTCEYDLAKDSDGWKIFNVMSRASTVIGRSASGITNAPNLPAKAGELPSTGSRETFQAHSFTSDKHLTDITLAPSHRDSIETFRFATPATGASLTNLMPVSR